MDLFRTKPITQFADRDTRLIRCLSAFDLTFMGIGAIIGAGIFVVTGIAAATEAGPAIIISYVIAGFAALFAALCYAELSASIGGCGSAYSYAYASMGEFIAWIIGWDLLLEYMMGVSTVAIGWSGYVIDIFTSIGLPLPTKLTSNPLAGGYINLPAVLIILILGILLSISVKQSARVNNAIVFIKLLTILTFIIAAIPSVNMTHWHNFEPFGFPGIVEGAALVFFAYIGFDAVSTAADEALNPQRTLPIGITISLIVCTILYMIVAALLTLIAPYQTLNVKSPVADVMLSLGHPTIAAFIAAGAVAALSTVMLVLYYGLTRVLYAMGQDQLLPPFFAKTNSKTHTPITGIIVTGIIMALVAGFTPIDQAAELVNIGTLSAFIIVCAGVAILRHTHPTLPRPFKLPWNPLLSLLGIILCGYLMCYLPILTWIRFFVWLGIGLIIYYFYSRKHSAISSQ